MLIHPTSGFQKYGGGSPHGMTAWERDMNGNAPAVPTDYVRPTAMPGTPGTAPFPQAYKDVSADSRRGLSSFFAYGKRTAERDAYQQAHMTPSGVPGVVNLAVMDPNGKPIPFAPYQRVKGARWHCHPGRS